MSKLIFLLFVVTCVMAVNHAAVRNPRCLQSIVSGLCFGYYPRFGYDPAIDGCVEFVYGGCGGNDNRFPSLEICEAACIA